MSPVGRRSAGAPDGEGIARRVVATPWGPHLAEAGPRGLLFLGAVRHLSVDGAQPDHTAADRLIAGPPEPDPGSTDPGTRVALSHLDQLTRDLARYVVGDLDRFTVDIDYDGAGVPPGLSRDAFEAIREVPFGETVTYGQVALDAGRPGAARAVGTLCRHCPVVLVVPVHRVRRADGRLAEHCGEMVAWEQARRRPPGPGGRSGSR